MADIFLEIVDQYSKQSLLVFTNFAVHLSESSFGTNHGILVHWSIRKMHRYMYYNYATVRHFEGSGSFVTLQFE